MGKRRKVLFLLLGCLLLCALGAPQGAAAERPYFDAGPNERAERPPLPEGWQNVEEYWLDLQRERGEYLPSWDLHDVWEAGAEGGTAAVQALLRGLLRFLFAEVVDNLRLMGQLIVLAVTASLLKNLQGSFGAKEVSRVTETVVFLVLLGVALSSFTVALDIGRQAVDTMSGLMLALLPVLLSLIASAGHMSSAALFHPFIVFAVHFMASMVRSIIFPLISFAVILYLANQFSPHFKVVRLADLFRDISIWALGLMLTVFVGFTSIHGVVGGVGDAITMRTAKYMTGAFVPVVGKMLGDAVETVLSYSMLLKNSVTLGGLALLAVAIAFPLLKILALVVIFRVAAALVQPLGESVLGEALQTMGNCLLLVFAAVVTLALAFFIGVAIMAGVSNAVIMMR